MCILKHCLSSLRNLSVHKCVISQDIGSIDTKSGGGGTKTKLVMHDDQI